MWESLLPLLLLAGGELALAGLGLRILAWVARGWGNLRAAGPSDPDDPGGGRLVPLPERHPARQPREPELRAAA